MTTGNGDGHRKLSLDAAVPRSYTEHYEAIQLFAFLIFFKGRNLSFCSVTRLSQGICF